MLVVVLNVPGGCACHYELVPGVFRQSVQGVGHLHGPWHGAGDLSLPGSCENRYVTAFLRPRIFVIVNGIHQRIALVDKWDSSGFEIRYLEGEDYEESVHPFL